MQEVNYDIYRTKLTVRNVCKGTDIYMVMLYLFQYAMLGGLMIVGTFVPDVYKYSDLFDGLMGLAAVASACVILFYFAQTKKDRGELFPEQGLRKSVFGRNRKISVRTFIAIASLIFFLQILSGFSLTVLELLLNLIGRTIMNSPAMNADYSVNPVLLMYACLIGPICEELVFRGFILKGLKPLGKVYAILVSAMLFSLMHGDIQQIMFTFIAGVIFGYVALEYSIVAAILLHIYNNGVLTEILVQAEGYMSENAYALLTYSLIVICAIISICYIVRSRHKIRAYIREDVTAEGAVGALFNRWFIPFAFASIYLVVTTITPV